MSDDTSASLTQPDGVFAGEIRVASRIIDYLSSGLYESPAACLKELVNNSFDADARRVDVLVKPDADRIVIDDDGAGMSKDEFIRHFDRVSESHKRDEADMTPSGRPKIGKIGIGFIAANEICDEMELISTKAGAKEQIHVSIDFAKMRQEVSLRRRNGTDIAKADYSGTVERARAEDHYTRLFLKGVRGEARQILAGPNIGPNYIGSVYGLGPDSVRDLLADAELRSWDELDAYSRTAAQVGLNIPVRYHEHWIPRRLQRVVRPFVARTEALQFAVFYDGGELRKPIVFDPQGLCIARRFTFSGDHVAADGYFYAQHGVVRPQDLNGLLIRVRNAAVGDYDPSFLSFPSSIGPLFQRWVSAEVWASDALEDALNIDRKTLRIAHPAYVELQRAIHAFLDSFLRVVREEIHGKAAEARNTHRALRDLNALRETLSAANRPELERIVMRTWATVTEDRALARRMARRRSVVELYEVVLDAMDEVLDPDQQVSFLRALSRRLRQ